MKPSATLFAYEIVNIFRTKLAIAEAFPSTQLIILNNSRNALGYNILSTNVLIICSFPVPL